MFDVAPSEFLLVAIVALVVIGPKDLPKVMRVLGHWVGRARGVTRQFRSGFDSMVREAELAEMEKKWSEENARIMREHSGVSEPEPVRPTPDTAANEAVATPSGVVVTRHADADVSHPITIEKPVVAAAPAGASPAADNKADS